MLIYPLLLDLSMYINLPLLFILVFSVVFIFSNNSPSWLINIFNTYLYIDPLQIKNSITVVDKVFLIISTSLFIGTMGTVPGHELTHRKKNTGRLFKRGAR